MGYLTEISFNGGKTYEKMSNVSHTDFRIQGGRDGETPRVRYQPSGDIIFYGEDYQKLLNEREAKKTRLPIRISFEETAKLIYEGTISLLGTLNEAENTCTLTCDPEDQYTRLLQLMDTEISKNPPLPNKTTIRTVLEFRTMWQMRPGCDNPFENAEWIYTGNSSPTLSTWRIDRCYKSAKKYQGGNCDSYVGDKVFSFCAHRVGTIGRRYICLQDNRGVEPFVTAGWEQYWLEVDSVSWEMGQFTSKIYFDGAYYDPQDKLWVKGAKQGQTLPFDWDINTYPLFDLLKDFISELNADPTLLINLTIDQSTFFPSLQTLNPNIGRLTLYRGIFPAPSLQQGKGDSNAPQYVCEKEDEKMITLTFKDLVNTIEAIFNVEWYLERVGDDWEFRFIHPSEDCRQLPDASQPNQQTNFINNAYSQDFSNPEFTDDPAINILSETWEFNGLEDGEPQFNKHKLTYDTPYTEIIDHSETKIKTDVATVFRNLSDDIVIIAEDAHGVMPQALSTATGEYVFNLYLTTPNIITRYHKHDRPFGKGSLYLEANKTNQDVTLIRKRDRKTTISIPAYDPFIINFKKQLVTTYGNLLPMKITFNAASCIAEIEAAKE